MGMMVIENCNMGITSGTAQGVGFVFTDLDTNDRYMIPIEDSKAKEFYEKLGKILNKSNLEVVKEMPDGPKPTSA